MQQREGPRPARTRVAPLMREMPEGNGGVQGVRPSLAVDEDGDEADEFFEVTDEGIRRRNPAERR